MESKYLAVDMHEETKWKKSIGFFLAKKAQGEFVKKTKNKKIDQLYQNSLNVYFLLNLSVGLTSLHEEDSPNDLTNYYKNQNVHLRSFQDKYGEWKELLAELRAKMHKVYAAFSKSSAEKLFSLMSLIENIVEIQEKKIEAMERDTRNNAASEDVGGLEDFIDNVDTNNENRQNFNLLLSNYVDGVSSLDFNLLHGEIEKIIAEISNEINIADIESVNIYRDIDKKYASNAKQKKKAKDGADEELSNLEEQNPLRLVFNFEGEPTSGEMKEILKLYCNARKVELIPAYDLRKLVGAVIDLNSVAYDKKNVIPKVFKAFENNQGLNRKRVYDEPVLKSKASKQPQASDPMADTRFSSLTPLQVVAILYGIFTYGRNPTYINTVLNSFSFSKCVYYPKDDMAFIIRKILDDAELEVEESFLSTCSGRFAPHENFDVECGIYLNEYGDFQYLRTMKNYLETQEIDMHAQVRRQQAQDLYKIKKCEFMRKNDSNHMLNRRKANIFSVVFGNKNLSLEYRRTLFRKVIDYLKGFFEKVRTKLVPRTYSKYNYFTGEVEAKPDADSKSVSGKENIRLANSFKNYPQIDKIKQQQSQPLDKSKLLKALRGSSNVQYSIRKAQADLVQNNNLVEEKQTVLRPYKYIIKERIKDNWNKMTKRWYQNNKQYNPLFVNLQTYVEPKYNEIISRSLLDIPKQNKSNVDYDKISAPSNYRVDINGHSYYLPSNIAKCKDNLLSKSSNANVRNNPACTNNPTENDFRPETIRDIKTNT